ncbi:MAG TPA: alpha amylase C-terminal domain-containing protein, partial [Candidatus Melainabacteria bacterium]|nr:alpha amylase C-terminal domain-containing protein [Candidatus Melainabacteria bacterium]
DNLTFRAIYQFTENFILPLSHDEVVHGKKSILGKMPGDDWQQFANARLLYSYQFTTPGKKLNFMGNEIGQWIEWKFDESLDWHLTEYDRHRGMQTLFRDLNTLYKNHPALYRFDSSEQGFRWIDCSDHANSVLAYLRKGEDGDKDILICLNFTPVPRQQYRVGVPTGGYWREIFNSDSTNYGGSGMGNLGGVHTEYIKQHGFDNSVTLTLPPLAAVVFEAP